jgi:hypothetical protein
VDGLSLFGLAAVTAMLIFYALEPRSRWFILAFAGACALGSIYAFLQGAWPFGVIEAVWAVVAAHRWSISRSSSGSSAGRLHHVGCSYLRCGIWHFAFLCALHNSGQGSIISCTWRDLGAIFQGACRKICAARVEKFKREDAMLKSLAVAFVILSAGLLLAGRAQAGASASAPSRYATASSAGAWAGWLRTRRVNPSSEFSSSNRVRRR